MSTARSARRMIRCPGCGEPSVYAADNVHRPFCSARCKGVDFGTWASEGYSVRADTEAPPAPGAVPDAERDKPLLN